MESFAYFDVGSHASLLREAPFLEAITGYLKDEGKAEGARTQIIIVKSKAFEHQTTAFRSSLMFDSKAYVVSGYAFIRHNGGRPVFEPLEVSYAQSGRLTITVSPSSRGNDLLFIGRLTLLPKAEFPRSLATELQMVLSTSGG